jgi:hypothetical protein
VSADTELWTRETGDIAPLLPRADEWDDVGDSFEFEGDGWLLTVFPPEGDPEEVPPDVAELVEGLRFRVELSVEPSDAPPEAWTLLEDVMASIGRGLGGAGLDPLTGHARSWADSPD